MYNKINRSSGKRWLFYFLAACSVGCNMETVSGPCGNDISVGTQNCQCVVNPIDANINQGLTMASNATSHEDSNQTNTAYCTETLYKRPPPKGK